MLRFLFMGDRHNIEQPPYSRIDNFHESCDAKDYEIINIAKEYNVTAILQPGDFWTDSDKRPTNEFVTRTALKWIQCGIPIIGIAGNHDLIGGNIASLPSTICGMMSSLGIMKIIANGETVEFSDGNVSVGITGTNYHKNMDKPEFISDYIVDSKTTDYSIHLVHGMLTPHDMGTLYRHTKIDEIKHTKADVTLCGHDHYGFGLIKYEDKFFCNPGAVVRLNCSEKELSRIIQVAIITIDKSGIDIEMIPLKSVKPSSEVLTRDTVENNERKLSYIEFVKDGVQKMNIGSGVSMTDVLEDIYNRDEIAENLRKSINKTIAEKTKSAKQQIINPPNGTEIVNLTIENFQSHENTTIDFDTGFNVILGESHQGKSAILRAIRWVAENKPSGKGIIRIGAKQAKVQIKLRNGTIIQRFVSTSTSAKDNGYRIYSPDGTVQEGNTKMLPDVRKAMGWSNMIVGEDEELPLNHLKQGDSWYLIGNAYTGSDRARILGAINNTDGADAAIKDFDKENSRISDLIKSENVEIENQLSELEEKQRIKEEKLIVKEILEKMILVEKIRDYQKSIEDFESKQRIVERINREFDESSTIQLMLNVRNSIDNLSRVNGYIETISREMKRISFADKTIMEVSKIDALDDVLDDASSSIAKLISIHGIRKTLSDETMNVDRYSYVISQMDKVNSDAFQLLSTDVEKLLTAKNKVKTIEKSERAIRVADRFIEQCCKIDDFDLLRKDIELNVDKASKIKSWCDKYNNAEKDNRKANDRCADAENNYQRCINKKLDILRTNHVCPTCMSTIDDGIIENIKIEMNKEN